MIHLFRYFSLPNAPNSTEEKKKCWDEECSTNLKNSISRNFIGNDVQCCQNYRKVKWNKNQRDDLSFQNQVVTFAKEAEMTFLSWSEDYRGKFGMTLLDLDSKTHLRVK